MVANFPQELTPYSQWVSFRFGPRKGNGKPAKLPLNPRTGTLAAVNDPATWATFPDAVRASQNGGCAGIGFVFAASDPFVGIDLDGCRDPHTGALMPWAAAIVQRLHSYTELSPSGTGIHILVRGTLLPGRRRCGDFEMYDTGRFFTVTGERLDGTPGTIEERTTEVHALYTEIFGTQVPHAGAGEGVPHGSGAPERARPLTDEEVLRKASSASNGQKFQRLFSGDWSGYQSQSEADLALCGMLAYWGAAPSQVDRSRAYGAEGPTPEHRSREAQRAACRSAAGRRRRQPLAAASAESEGP